ncbi:hypothetical protein MNBD_GAMMA10-1043 [hydrothermal vent metagenome]|uniref:Uncharacterized protein n=1 Tax=hydrothermal vent metagenome TaxID=652676 RepID=A0A3B0Y778_9ZZZZ
MYEHIKKCKANRSCTGESSLSQKKKNAYVIDMRKNGAIRQLLERGGSSGGGVIQRGKEEDAHDGGKEFAYTASVFANNIMNMLGHSPWQLFGAKSTSLIAGGTKLLSSIDTYKSNGYINPLDIISSAAYLTEGVAESLMIPHVFFNMHSPLWFQRVAPMAGSLADASQAFKYYQKDDMRKTFYYSSYTAGNLSMLYKGVSNRMRVAIIIPGLVTHLVDEYINKKESAENEGVYKSV